MPDTSIPGLTLIHRYVTEAQERALLIAVDFSPWLTTMKRRVQHYGWRYDYKARRVSADQHLGDLPTWAAGLARRMFEEGHAPIPLDQLIVNEYEPGQGIALHVDCVPCFGDTILSLTLGSSCVMDFESLKGGRQVALPLNPGDLLIMRGESRYEWKHGIAARKTDAIGGRRLARGRRISLTFRTVFAPHHL